jgi:hypothetical protein
LFQCAVQASVSHSLSTRHAASISSILKYTNQTPPLRLLRSAKNKGPQRAAIDKIVVSLRRSTPHLISFPQNLDADMLFDESGTTSDGDHPDPNFRYAFCRKPSAAFVMGILVTMASWNPRDFDQGGCSDYQPTMQYIQISEGPKIRRFGAIFPEHRLHCPPSASQFLVPCFLVLRSMVPLSLIAIHSVHP